MSRWGDMTTEERFWSHVDRTGGCWLWTGTMATGGYGLGPRIGGTRRAHKIAWIVSNGPVPAGMDVCHRCDVRLCVRPDHLWLGTRAQNNADMAAKGRGRGKVMVGEDHPASKLTWTAVDVIRAAAGAGTSHHELARRFGVSRPLIDGVVNGKSWRVSDRPGPGHRTRRMVIRMVDDDISLHGEKA